ncbi:MAG: preprotein translocase subunit SecE [Deltaproteobacteria bacterium]|nr:preprotein translocase subunit SecE [Deltaproteobacteria bacterium]
MAKKKNKRRRAKNTTRKDSASVAATQDDTALKTRAAKAPAKKKAVVKAPAAGPKVVEKTRQFFREVRIELLKVNWPSRKETIASTAVVLVLVIIISAYLGLVDAGLSRLMRFILG